MSILAAIRCEENKVKKQLAKLRHHLSDLQSAAKVPGRPASRDSTSTKNGVLSAAGTFGKPLRI
jgi:hypothetical protein